LASDEAKTTSQTVSGYAIRTGLAQKMAPGDKMFYIVSYEDKKMNKMNSYKTRPKANLAFGKFKKDTPRIMISGETGDIVQATGDQNWRDQCLGMFLT